jgi:hypothetical protein
MSTLATLASLKARLGVDEFETDFDAQLTNYLELVTGRFELECNRKFLRTVGDTFEFHAGLPSIIPERLPIESVSAIALKTDETEGWVAQTGVLYLIAQKGALLTFTGGPLGGDTQLGRITYTGGYVLPGTTVDTGQTALPNELEHAAIEQAVYYWQNRDRLGLSSVSGEGGSIAMNPASVVKPLDLLSMVLPVLKKYERLVLV